MDITIDGIKYVPVPTLSSDKNLLNALELRFDSDAGENITIRDYFRILLETLWREQEGFSGKRPFGNSCWDYEVYSLLIKNGYISGELNEDGYIDKFDEAEAYHYVQDLIVAAFHGIEQ